MLLQCGGSPIGRGSRLPSGMLGVRIPAPRLHLARYSATMAVRTASNGDVTGG